MLPAKWVRISMGDGGVACMSLQHNVMERFPIPEKTAQLCTTKNSNNGFPGPKPVKKKKKKIVKVKKVNSNKKNTAATTTTTVAGGSSSNNDNTNVKELENNNTNTNNSNVGSGDTAAEEKRDEIEEGELGSLKWVLPGKGETEAAAEKSEAVEAGEIVPGKWRRGETELSAPPWRGGGGYRDEIEKGEFVPERWPRDDHRYPTTRRSWKWERERTPPPSLSQPPPPRYANEDSFRRKEFNRGGGKGNNNGSNPRWEFVPPERNVRISSKIVADDNNNVKSGSSSTYGKEFSGKEFSGNRFKRYNNNNNLEPEANERKHYGDYIDYSGQKSRRLSDDRPYRTPRIPPPEKYSGRSYDSGLSSRPVYDRHARSPAPMDRSPRDRGRYYEHRDRSPVRRDRSPYGRERSPYDRSRQYDHKNRSQSPLDRPRYHDRRDRTPNYSERSPLDRARPSNNRETGRKFVPGEKRNSQAGNKVEEDKPAAKEPPPPPPPPPVVVVKESSPSAKESEDKSTVVEASVSVSADTNANCGEISKEEDSQSPGTSCKETSSPTILEEPPSMEEDMDICDTPPHVTVVSETSAGKWFYLNYCGLECGPSKLCDLKALMEDGSLMSDHMVKHEDSDRWMTIENAVSPVVTVNFPSIIPDSITQLVSPPEAPGNLLVDSGEFSREKPDLRPDSGESVSEPLEDLQIDQRVEALLEGISVVPGNEVEAVEEILQMMCEYARRNEWGISEGLLALYLTQINEQDEQISDETSTHSEVQEGAEDYILSNGDSSDWFSGRWSCKGGDWLRIDEATQERPSRKKLVLNDGYPLCQMPKSGYEDPRWHRKDDTYHPSQGRRLDLPHWGFSIQDERGDPSGTRPTQGKPSVVRGVKGTMLPVVRINACVVKDHGSFVSESRMKVRGKERFAARSTRPYSASSDGKRSSAESDSQSRTSVDRSSHGTWKYGASIDKPKDSICIVDDLQLHFGEWYYLDGAGHEQGPSSFKELQALADQGIILKGSSVFRKFDRVWVPITSAAESSEQTLKSQQESTITSGDLSAPLGGPSALPTLFNNLHPQFIGYTLGKLHELVMKSYKSREFAAAINEVLDPWINTKQPKKEIEKHIYWKTDGDPRAAKRARLLFDDSEDDNDIEDNEQIAALKAESTFEELCSEASFCREESISSEYGTEGTGGWGALDGHVLARVFHFLRADMKSLAFASVTCKHWRAAVGFYRGISRQIDFSSFAPICTDSVILNIMSGYSKDKISSMVLIGCTNVTSSSLEEILSLFPVLSTIDIRCCSQFNELTQKFQNVNWIKSRNPRVALNVEDSHSKVRSLRHITDRSSSVSKIKGLTGDMDDFGDLKEYFNSVDKRDSANQLFRHSLYKRSKLFDARKSSSILSRDARTRRWAIKKSENGYKRMEEFLASSLKDIMKENTFDFFVPKVAEIQDRMKKGYYIGRGLGSVKEDISRMCRDAIKAKKRGDAGNMNRIVTLFIQLAIQLEKGPKSLHEKDMLKLYEDDSSSGFSSTSKYKKKLNKVVTERKYRSNGTSSLNGGLDYGEDASDREIKRRLSKLNKRSFDSESDTSDDPDRSFEDSKSVSESTISDTESEKSEDRTWQSGANGKIILEDNLDSMTDDREWGARMTKASLVPPVTRKYEVIDQYVIVADEDEVKRKMQVSLPDDYVEKLSAQKNGIDESDMELPEVKDYKPRKELGSEVLEQEVYGIDPYTHNLLLDSMPDETDCPLLEKHVFIEDVLLRTLNKKVRQFTGTGNTPMVYPLQPVIEEIHDSAEDNEDFRTVRTCQSLLRAIDSRSDDKYVAYRKGLGVVCNKEGGFVEDDFVVEFLGEVYPVWKWFEKQDGIRSLQKNSDDPAPEFYNIYLERPKGDADGYDLVVVDAMHKANYASRICHSCRPNCEAKVTAVDGHYQIGIYAVRSISHGEEITFDYNSVTESKEEYEASVCLCGSQVCRGSYLNLTGEGAFQKVLKDWHGVLDRHQLMLEACEANSVSEEDYLDLGRAGLGSCLLGGLPDWLIAYSARLVRFINLERTKLPDEILKHNLEEKRKYFSEICLEVETSDAEVQAEGVYNQRLQNLAVTLDKVRYVMRSVFGDPKTAPPPLERLSPEAAVSFLWKGEGSLVEELLDCLMPHVEEKLLDDLKSKILAHDPSGSEDIQKELRKSLLWLRDEVQTLPCTSKSRNDAAADLIHIYAYTKSFFRIREYKAVASPPVYISPLDLGPKHKEKLGSSGLLEYSKTYGENYCLGQLIFWHNQTNSDPDSSLTRVSRGCLSLPELSSFYAKIQKPSRQRVYGPKTLRFILNKMEKLGQKPWPKDRIWLFNNSPKVIGSPMLDAVLSNAPLDREMVHWLKHRPTIYQALWDR